MSRLEIKNGYIELSNVKKSYKIYPHLKGGIKNFIVNFREIFKSSTSFTALENINIKIKPGEAVGIIGKNGAGKSTLLSLIAGVEKPTSGKIIARGRIVPMLELGAGFHPDLTGRENIILNGVLLGLRRKEVLRLMNKIIEFSELGDFIDEPVRIYSSGMLSRLGFSVVSQVEGDIVLIDEVLAVGDKDFQKKCLYTMMNMKRKGATILLVSHNTNDIEFLCDRVIWIKDHKIHMDGKVDIVLKNYMEEDSCQ